LLEDRSPFADGDNILFGSIEGEQLAESPDAGEIKLAFHAHAFGAPSAFKEGEVFDSWKFAPVVLDIQQSAAFLAGDTDFRDGACCAAAGVDALLKRCVAHATAVVMFAGAVVNLELLSAIKSTSPFQISQRALQAMAQKLPVKNLKTSFLTIAAQNN
jgi:hypothetical protein